MEIDYFPKNILITGGAGFIASNVIILLVKKYPHYKIINLDILNYCSSLKNLSSIENFPNYKFIKGSINSPDLLNYIMKEENIDTVMNFAAETHVDNSFGNSLVFTRTNVLGTHILLESSKSANIKRFIHVSTDEVYGEIDEKEENAMEEKVLEPTNPYAATKAAAEFIVKSYNKSFGLPTIITRGNNVYGPHQYPEKIIPKFILRLKRNLPCCLHGNGSNKRNYIYVGDVARAFDYILHKGSVSQIYNIGTDFEHSNVDVARDIIKLYGKEEDEYIQYVEDRKYNDKRYAINSQKLNNLGWNPIVGWEEGLKITKEWYLENESNWENKLEESLKPHPKFH